MPEFPAASPSPHKVHGHAAGLIGIAPTWVWTHYRGGIYRMDHYRRCSWCGCIHPSDMMALLRAGRSSLERTGRFEKRIFRTPNPIAGRSCVIGSIPGAVFERDREPADLVSKLLLDTRPGISPTISERLAEHYDRPAVAIAPEMIEQPFYLDHTSDAQWDDIMAAQAQGERKSNHAEV